MRTPASIPVRHVLSIRGPCNNRCRVCGASIGKAARPVLPAVRSGDILQITGAEPTLVPAIFDIARRAAGRGCAVTLFTNGRAFAYPECARRAAASRVAAVSISFHGTTAEAHDTFTRAPGSFGQAVAGARNLRRAGVRVEIRAPAGRSAAEVRAMIEFAAALGGRQVTFLVPDPARSVFDRAAGLEAVRNASTHTPARLDVLVGYRGLELTLTRPPAEVEFTLDPATGNVSAAPRNWCSNHCIFCTPKALFARHGLPVPLDTAGGFAAALETIAARTKRRGVFEFTTIEPAESPHLLEMAEIARRAGYRRLDLWTHGRTLSDAGVARDLMRAGFGAFRIPIHGPDAATHDLVAGSHGAFAETIAGVDNLRAMGVDMVSYCATLTVSNQDRVDELGSFARSRLGVDFLPVADARPSTSYPADFRGYACRLGRLARAIELSGVYANAAIGFLPPCLFRDAAARAAALAASGAQRDDHIGWLRKGHEHKERAPCPGAPRCRWSDCCPGINPQYGALFGYGEFRPAPRGGHSAK
ncbi:MAG: hypothetical protein HY897_13805 [Deltaproteobacteria bacterium]|nr:hypothetical protein [Deltaproteobacteria bacterium]